MKIIKSIICPILNLTAFLFSFDGRIGRGMYWLLNLVVLPIYLIIFRLISGLLAAITDPLVLKLNASEIYWAANIVYVIVNHFHFFLLAWMACSVQLKRYHDLNKAGWWQFILIVLATKTLMVGGQLNIVPMIAISAVVILGLLVEMGTFKGKDENDYGTRTIFKDLIKNEGLALAQKITGMRLLKEFIIMVFIYFGAQFFKVFLSITLR